MNIDKNMYVNYCGATHIVVKVFDNGYCQIGIESQNQIIDLKHVLISELDLLEQD